MKASRQLSLYDATTQLQQHSEASEVHNIPWTIPRSDIKVLSMIEVRAWGIMAKGIYCGQQVAVKMPHLKILHNQTN